VKRPVRERLKDLGWLFRTEFRRFRQTPANSGNFQKPTPDDTEFALGIPEPSVKYSGLFTGCRLCTRLWLTSVHLMEYSTIMVHGKIFFDLMQY
jgi:hypothetical protein